MSKNRRKFTLDYKVEAAYRVIDTGRTSTEVAQELSINEASLRAWVERKEDELKLLRGLIQSLFRLPKEKN
jgi:transposase-like protein